MLQDRISKKIWVSRFGSEIIFAHKSDYCSEIVFSWKKHKSVFLLICLVSFWKLKQLQHSTQFSDICTLILYTHCTFMPKLKLKNKSKIILIEKIKTKKFFNPKLILVSIIKLHLQHTPISISLWTRPDFSIKHPFFFFILRATEMTQFVSHFRKKKNFTKELFSKKMHSTTSRSFRINMNCTCPIFGWYLGFL